MKVVIVLCACAFAVALANAPECKSGETKNVDCNSCFCTETGVWACTLIGCSRPKREDENCTPNDQKFIGCNSCTCVENFEGRTAWACTRKFCVTAALDTNECRTVGEIFSVDCNSCRCVQTIDDKKQWSCTNEVCDESEETRVKRDNGVASDLNHTPCASNDMFQIDCNTCYCNSAKTGYLCTDHICMPSDNSTEIPIKNDTTTATTKTVLTTLQLNSNETETFINVTKTAEENNSEESDSAR